MQKDIIYFSDFPNCQAPDKKRDGKFDLSKLPTETFKDEFRRYIIYRGENGKYTTLVYDNRYYKQIVNFLNRDINRNVNSLSDRTAEKWIMLLKGWMMEQGFSITKENKSIYGTINYGETPLVLYLKRVLKFLEPADLRDEIERMFGN